MQKILIFTTAFRPFIGGSELAIEETVKRLPNFFFEIITPKIKKSLPNEELGSNFRINRIGGAGLILDKFLFPINGFLYSRKFLSAYGGKNIIVHAYQASHGAGAAWLVKIFYPKTTFILTLQEGKDPKKQGILINFFRKLIIWKTDRATAISTYLRAYLLSVRKDLPVSLIPNGVNVDSFSRQFSYGDTADLEKKLGIQPDDKVIVSASRFVPKNGLDLLIKALALIKEKNPSTVYKLILVGDAPPGEGQHKEKLELLVSEHNLRENVIFAGSVEHEELPLYLKISDVFVRPSRSEGLGSAFLEAMAAGVPIIGTRVGGIPDFLEDRKTGLFCSWEPEDIAFKMRIIFENDKLKQELINNARELVKDKYSWDAIAQKFDELYNEII
ncbi:MAG: glycosyltransferase family 4 protein [Candidatus Yanofskybacteria bacterium]|nr:glycosyltransferase family 4 protein [Candidatus Yanofskybacteria bacterium]